MAKKIFKESLRLPLLPGLIASLVIGTIFWVIMQKVLFGSIRFMLPPWPFLLINYCLPFVFFCGFPMVKTSVKGKTLTVRFSMGRYYIENIPLNNTISCQNKAYRSSVWDLIFPNFYQDGLKKINLPGFNGDGVLLTYTKEKIFTGEKYTSRILIPTGKLEELSRLIGPFLPADDTDETR